MNKLVNLKDNDDILIPKVFAGIDVDNKLAEYNNPLNTNITAPQDCIAVITALDHCGTFYLDGQVIGEYNARAGNYACSLIFEIPMKNGQVLRNEFTRATNGKITLYGIKY